MRAKKTRQVAAGVQYLLSADQKLRKLSLRKISERVTTTKRRTRSRTAARASKAVVAEQQAEPITSTPPGRALVFVGVGTLAVAALVAMGRPATHASNANAVGARTDTPTPVLTADLAPDIRPVIEPPSPAPVRAAPEAARVASAPATSAAPPPPARKTPATDASPAPADAIPVSTEDPETTVPPQPAPVESVRSAENSALVETVTISGCLQHDDRAVWLTEAEGADAPKARSWRSGFFRKRSARITLVNGPAAAAAYAGQRVSATGVLVDREMRVESLVPLAGDCN